MELELNQFPIVCIRPSNYDVFLHVNHFIIFFVGAGILKQNGESDVMKRKKGRELR
jgi:hypothetical protein